MAAGCSRASREIIWLSPPTVEDIMKNAVNKRGKSFDGVRAAFLTKEQFEKYKDVLFVCNHCTSIFKSKSSLSEHLRYVHESTIVCNQCQKDGKDPTFSSPTVFNTHLRRVHKDMDTSDAATKRTVVKRQDFVESGERKLLKLKEYKQSDLVDVFKKYCEKNLISVNQRAPSAASSELELTENNSSPEVDYIRKTKTTVRLESEDSDESDDGVNVVPETQEEIPGSQISVSDSHRFTVSSTGSEVNDNLNSESHLKNADPLRVRDSESHNSDTSVDDYHDTGMEIDTNMLCQSNNDSSQNLDQEKVPSVESITDSADVIQTSNNHVKWFFPDNLPILKHYSKLEITTVTTDLCQEIKKLYCEEIPGDLKIETNDKKLIRCHSFIWSLWNETLHSPNSKISINVSSEACWILLKLLYTDELDSPLDILLELYSLIDISPTIFKVIERCTNTKFNSFNLSEIWQQAKSKKNMNRQALVAGMITYVLRNPEVVLKAENRFFEIPNEILLLMIPHQLEKTISEYIVFADKSIRSRKSPTGKLFINVCPYQLTEYLFCWALNTANHMEHCQTLQSILGRLIQLIDTDAYDLAKVKLDSHDHCISFTKGSYYYKMILQDVNPHNSFRISENLDFLGQETRAQFYLLCNRPDEAAPTVLGGLKYLLKREFQNQKLADVIFMTDDGEVQTSSFVINHCAPHLLRTQIEANNENNDVKKVKVHCRKSQLQSLFQAFYDGSLENISTEHAVYILYISYLYGNDFLREKSIEKLLKAIELKAHLSPCAAVLLLENIVCGFKTMDGNTRQKAIEACTVIIKRQWQNLIGSEIFYVIPKTSTMKLILEIEREAEIELDLVFAVNRWCQVQEKLDSRNSRESLKNSVKDYLNLKVLNEDQRVQMQEQTSFLTWMEYDRLVRGIWPSNAN